uniref:Uncharacterized protein n=1 Tax=Tanacetum cinerariifolium TaxID=118510 RepID=A0A6L2LAE9_TANCI|nr:hypothetical protein [Tanacetum cinerariifolium]
MRFFNRRENLALKKRTFQSDVGKVSQRISVGKFQRRRLPQKPMVVQKLRSLTGLLLLLERLSLSKRSLQQHRMFVHVKFHVHFIFTKTVLEGQDEALHWLANGLLQRAEALHRRA